MKFKPQKWQIIAGSILVVLIFLNPSLEQFTDFIGHSKFRMEQHNLVRKSNFLILSIYGDQTLDNNGDPDSEIKYIGILNNFISLH